jgi:molecular chaperone DnaK (HSP70)
LPLLGLAGIVVIGRYSYKALKRMDAEWNDYQWELLQYERRSMVKQQQSSLAHTKTVAIDLGSIYTKIAASYPTGDVVVTRQGDRSLFNGIVYDDGHEPVRGRQALERYYYSSLNSIPNSEAAPCPVTLPWNVLISNGTNGRSVVTDVLTPALVDVLERMDYKKQENDMEASSSSPTLLRSVVTVPTAFLPQSARYSAAFADVGASTFLPESVAAIWGAQSKSLLPGFDNDDDKKLPSTTLVVDVGGLSSQLSVVQKDKILGSLSLPWGGERWIQLLMDLMTHDKPSIQDARSLAALQMQARSAVTELSSKSRVHIHVPYIFSEPGDHHLDTTMARHVWEQAIQHDIRDRLVFELKEADSSVWSPHLPSPTDMESLWTSTATQVLELAGKLPTNIDHVLLVGGASRAPLVTASLQKALYNMMGPDAQKKLVVPESALAPELTVLGAATLLPNYEYSLESGGLYRRESAEQT